MVEDEAGARTHLRGVEGFEEISLLLLHHHERLDGRGYPGGLRGEEIPFGARIITVADSFDAMTTNRPYRKAGSPEAAAKELLRCAGTQFDPVVVEAFMPYLNHTSLNLTDAVGIDTP